MLSCATILLVRVSILQNQPEEKTYLNKVISNLDVATEEHWSVRILLLGDGDQFWHLRIVDDDDICSALGGRLERTFVFEPVALCIVDNPAFNFPELLVCATHFGANDALEDIVVGLGDAKHVRPGLWYEPASYEREDPGRLLDVPFNLDTFATQEAQQSVPHQCDTTTLRGCAKEGYPELSIFDVLDILLDCAPRRLTDRAVVVFGGCEVDLAGHINVYLITIVDSNARLLGRTENSNQKMLAIVQTDANRPLLTRGTSGQQNLRAHPHSQLEKPGLAWQHR